jgi:hypothetical protein
LSKSIISSGPVFRIFEAQQKTRWRLLAGGLRFLPDLSGRLAQAMAVRRHGGPMMMVVTVMAVEFHLIPSYGKGCGDVK